MGVAVLKARLIETRDIGPDIRHFTFDVPEVEQLPYLPGQFVSLSRQFGEKKITRAYSTASPPSANRFQLCLNRVQDGIDIARNTRPDAAVVDVNLLGQPSFPIARARFGFLDWFDGIVISGELGVAKPDPRIFAHLLDTYALRADATVFIDDVPANVAAAVAAGMHAILFTDPEALDAALRELELL